MNRYFISAAVFAFALAAQATAQIDEDAPRRLAAERIDLTADHIATGACATRLLARSARVTNYPLRDGVGIEWTPKVLPFMSSGGDPMISMEFLDDKDGAYLVVRYRHPLSIGRALDVVRKAAKTCFRDDWNSWAGSAGQQLIEVNRGG